ncbi:MAG: ATP-dependent Clp protease adapter ClpS [Gammaproteobacteria bacterium]|nr:MAG: ATP-dependent Clp protease adapter ClpS [Gammaproteobacteria bacterium]
MNRPDDFDDDKDVGVAEAKPKLKRPDMFQVLLINDDFTPMDFVIDVLVQFFSMNDEKATQVMFQVHTEGKGICGVFTVDVAQTKVKQVSDYSQEHQHPLLCVSQRLE